MAVKASRLKCNARLGAGCAMVESRLRYSLTSLRFITPDGAVIHASCGVTRGSRVGWRRRTSTSVAVRTHDGWLVFVLGLTRGYVPGL
jgi:hypothetical protein